MSNAPKTHDDPEHQGGAKHPGKTPPPESGVPPEADEMEAKGTPDTGRLESEIRPHKT